MTKRPRSSGNGIKAVFLLGGVATSVLSAALIAAQDKRTQAAAPSPAAEAMQVQDVVVIDPNALPPVPTARPYTAPQQRSASTVQQQQPAAPAAQAPASGGAAANAPVGIPTAIVPVLPQQSAAPAAQAPAAPPAAPVTSSRSSGG